MSVALSDIRLAIQDLPKRFPRVGNNPVSLGMSDGVQTIFFLPLPRGAQVYGSMVLYEKTSSTNYTQIASNLYTFSAPDQITFLASPSANTEVGARFTTVGFQDSDLASELARALLDFSTDDLVLKKCQYDLIPYILMNQDLMMYLREADFEQNPADIRQSLTELRKMLVDDITQKNRPGKHIPTTIILGENLCPWTPER